MVRNRQPVATYAMVVILATTPVLASVRTANFAVSAQDVARTSIEPVDEPATVLLTRADLLQGYKVLHVHYALSNRLADARIEHDLSQAEQFLDGAT